MRHCAAPNFRLATTLASGQTFRWQQVGEWYYGVLDGALIRVRQVDDELQWDTSDAHLTAERLTHYFALDHDLEHILATIDRDDHIHAAIVAYRGLRLMRQEPWECLASYLLTSFNNIQRITRMIENLSQHFGQSITCGSWQTYTFPPPEVLAEVPVGRLSLLGLGFRAAHLVEVARHVASGAVRLETLHGRTYAEIKQTLTQLPGIGDKVADCIALFAFQCYAAFPIDVWTRRALALYLPRRDLTLKRMHAFASTQFGAYAGYAQQYLYHWLRTRAAWTRRSPVEVEHRTLSRWVLQPMQVAPPLEPVA